MDRPGQGRRRRASRQRSPACPKSEAAYPEFPMRNRECAPKRRHRRFPQSRSGLVQLQYRQTLRVVAGRKTQGVRQPVARVGIPGSSWGRCRRALTGRLRGAEGVAVDGIQWTDMHLAPSEQRPDPRVGEGSPSAEVAAKIASARPILLIQSMSVMGAAEMVSPAPAGAALAALDAELQTCCSSWIDASWIASYSVVVRSKSLPHVGGHAGFAAFSAGVRSRRHRTVTESRLSWLQYASSPLFCAPGVGSIFASSAQPDGGRRRTGRRGSSVRSRSRSYPGSVVQSAQKDFPIPRSFSTPSDGKRDVRSKASRVFATWIGPGSATARLIVPGSRWGATAVGGF